MDLELLDTGLGSREGDSNCSNSMTVVTDKKETAEKEIG